MYDDLGDTEVVNKASLRLDHHIDILEKRVDDLEAENNLLRRKLDGATKPSTVTQERYDNLCNRYQELLSEMLPF